MGTQHDTHNRARVPGRTPSGGASRVIVEGTGVDVVMIPVVLDDVDANTPGLTAVADDGVLLLEAVVK